jgi:hypothetical protein
MNTLVAVHVIVSFVAIVSGIGLVSRLLSGRHPDILNAVFFTSAFVTTLSGFLFPITRLNPPLVAGQLSMLLLPLAAWAWWHHHLRGAWKHIYVVGVLATLWFNVVILLVQAFFRVPTLRALAPTGWEPAAAAAQGLAFALIVSAGYALLRRPLAHGHGFRQRWQLHHFGVPRL